MDPLAPDEVARLQGEVTDLRTDVSDLNVQVVELAGETKLVRQEMGHVRHLLEACQTSLGALGQSVRALQDKDVATDAAEQAVANARKELRSHRRGWREWLVAATAVVAVVISVLHP